MKNRGNTRVRLRPGMWVKRAGAAVSALIVGLSALVAGTIPAAAAVSANDPMGLGRIGYLVSDFRGWNMWLGNQIPSQDGLPQFCVVESLDSPTDNENVSVVEVPESGRFIPDVAISRAEGAWLLHKYGSSQDRVTVAAVSLIVHANFEQPRPAGMSGLMTKPPTGYSFAPRDMARWVWDGANANLPQVVAKAKQLVAEAHSSGVKGYGTDVVTGDGQRTGTVTGFHILNGAGAYIPGIKVTVKLSGPAVWVETGTQTITFKTVNGNVTKAYRATGNGSVSYSTRYKDPTGSLKKIIRGQAQSTVKYDNTSKEVTVPGSSWRVVFDFRPVGESHAVKVVDGGRLTDSFVAQADLAYGDGSWVKTADGSFVPVVYRASAYFVDPMVAPAVAASVPATARLVKSVTVTATGPGQKLTADAGVASQPGFYAWVWEVKAGDQQAVAAPMIKAGWSDGFGKPDETTSARYGAVIDSQLHVNETKSGQYLVDDVWVRGLPSNHPDFKGGAGFKPDRARIEHRVFFFPKGVVVSDQNLSQARQVGDMVSIPAKNGFYPSVGDESWMLLTDKAGHPQPGTYVFVSRFAGDDRVKPLQTSVADQFEQFGVESLDSTLTFNNTRGKIYAYGERSVVDRVPLFNLKKGASYTLISTLVDKASGQPLQDGAGKPVVRQTRFTAEKVNDQKSVTFTLDGSLYAGKTIVAFERLVRDGKPVAFHEDIDDAAQTLAFYPKPGLKTTLMYENKKDPVPNFGSRTLIDKVAYQNVEPGKKYRACGTLMDKATGKPLTGKAGKPITSCATVIPKEASGFVNVSFLVDAELLAGKTTVAFEKMLYEGKQIAVHADLNDEGQTLRIHSRLHTTATDKADGDHVLKPTSAAVITDKVCDPDKSLVPGTTYQITATVMDKASGQPLTDGAGKPVTSTISFTPSSHDECAVVEIPFDASGLDGRTVVVFEDIALKGETISRHHDVNDQAQTVRFEKPGELPQTGSSMVGVLAGLAGAILAGGVGLLTLRRKFSLM